MPPSTSLRCSPRREHRIENNYRRGHRVEGGSPVKTKDDDLLLFNDMQLHERDNFLLHSTDNLEESLSKLKDFSDFKLNIPVRGESSDLLNVDNEKNDYDWLLTPPDTPLFASLDDDEPTQDNLVSRSILTEPIMISRPPLAEKTQRTSRSSISPCQRGSSPLSAHGMPQSGGRPSYTPFSPTRVLRPMSPSRMPASPPYKSSTPTPRSLTPTLRKMSPGSNGNISSSARRGTSPVKASRTNSTSPKLRGWQSNTPGFSSESSPNLQTSLSDRPASHEGGPSPAYRNRGDPFLRSGRQSLSPTASRRVSSSHSHDKVIFKSHSKGSIASSGIDDDVDSLFSDNVGMSTSPVLRKNGTSANNRNMRFSKKLSSTLSASPAPKSSFDFAFQQLDQQKSLQSMFRPLSSSVPPSTFYIGKANIIHRHMFSRNSSLTTSSNASSDLGASVAPDTQGNERDQEDIVSEWEKKLDVDTQEDIFAFDKMEEIIDIENEISTRKPQNIHGNFDGNIKRTIEHGEPEHLTSGFGIPIMSPTSEFSYAAGDHSHVDSIVMMVICCKCNKSFRIFEATDGNVDVCQQCAENDECSSYGMYAAGLTENRLHVSDKTCSHPNLITMADGSCEKSQIGLILSEVAEETSQSFVGQHQNSAERGHDFLADISSIKVVTDERERHLPAENIECQPEVFSTSDSGNYNFQQLLSFGSNQNLKIDGHEGAGISVLLKRPNSGNGPIVQGRSLGAASIFCAEPSYTRENVNALNVGVTGDNSSALPSVDLSSSGQSEACTQPTLSSSKIGTDCVRSESGLNSESTEPFLPDASGILFEDLSQTKLLHTKDNLDALKICVTWGSSSVSSPTGFSSLIQTEANIQRESSSSNAMECVRIDDRSKEESIQMFLSEVSSNSREDLSPAHVSRSEEKIDSFVEVLLHRNNDKIIKEHTQSPEKTESCVSHSSSIKGFLVMGDEILHSGSCEVLDSSPELVDETQCALLVNVSTSDAATDEHHASSVNSEASLSQHRSATEKVMLDKILEPYKTKEDGIINASPCNTGISETLLQSSSGTTAVLEDDYDSLGCPQTESEASKSMCNIVEAQVDSISPILEEEVLISGVENEGIDHVDDIHGELAITVDGPWGNKSRCLTLEEATDTILFCSSIIHDLAFKATTIGIEKECSSTKEVYRPTAITSGKSAFDEKDQRKASSRHTTKPLKGRRQKSEMDASILVSEPENKMKIDEFPTLNTEFPNKAGSVKPVKLESKCNCTVM